MNRACRVDPQEVAGLRCGYGGMAMRGKNVIDSLEVAAT